MKLSILLVICLIASTMAVTPACVSSTYCKGCSNTTATSCTSCYNSTGTVGPRFLADAKCEGALDLITNCKTYSKSFTSKTTATVTEACFMCDDKTYWAKELKADAAATITVTCSKTPQTGCTLITDCAQSICKGVAATGLHTCALCDVAKGAKADGTACDATIITNCSQEYSNGTAAECYNAATGYAVAVGLTSVIAYTTDVNCQILLDATQCGTCKDTYWWDTTKCALSAKLLGAAFLAVVALFIN
jgi:hypothetical protein